MKTSGVLWCAAALAVSVVVAAGCSDGTSTDPVGLSGKVGQRPAGQVAAADLPELVLAAIATAVPGGVIGEVETDTEDSVLVYEAGVTNPEGQTLEVKVDAAGAVLKIEADDEDGDDGHDGDDPDDTDEDVEQGGEQED